MCGSVEMLSRFSAEKFFSESVCLNSREKCRQAHSRRFFNRASLPLASTTLYSEAQSL
jgi:hypothetical protein